MAERSQSGCLSAGSTSPLLLVAMLGALVAAERLRVLRLPYLGDKGCGAVLCSFSPLLSKLETLSLTGALVEDPEEEGGAFPIVDCLCALSALKGLQVESQSLLQYSDHRKIRA